MILTIVICSCFLVFSGECVVYKSVKIGGDGGNGSESFDDLSDNNLLAGERIFRLVNVLLKGTDVNKDVYGLHTIQAKYAILNGTSPSTLDGHLFSGSRAVVPEVCIQFELSGREIIEKMYGHYRSEEFEVGLNIYVINHLAFDIRRANGTIQHYGYGAENGANFTVLGPIVGFYGDVGYVIDSIGTYVDPSLWPDRPSRLVMGPTGGRRYGNGEQSDNSFDHNIKLGEPFVTRIAELVIFYSTSSGVNGMSVVYEDNLRNSSTISSGSTGGKNVTVIFELGDYIKVLEINNADGQASTDFCLAGLQLTIFRAGREVNETIPVGTINSTESTTLRTDGPVVAFYGLIQGRNQPCIARLGGYRLLQSSELNRTCSPPDIPGCTLLGETPLQIFANHVLTLACGNLSYVTVCGTTQIRCREDGIWEKRETCTVTDIPGCTLLGETPHQISENNILAFACGNSSNVTTFGTTLMRCRENGTWEEVILDNRGACTVSDIPGCTLLGETPQQISANHVIAFACDNNATGNVTAFGATLMRCRENGTWEEVILDNRETCTVTDIPGCTLLGETPQQIYENNILAFACGNSSNVTACGTTLIQCREDGTWEEVKHDNRARDMCTETSLQSSVDVPAVVVGVVGGSLIFMILVTVFKLGICVHFWKKSKQTTVFSAVFYNRGSETNSQSTNADEHNKDSGLENPQYQQPRGTALQLRVEDDNRGSERDSPSRNAAVCLDNQQSGDSSAVIYNRGSERNSQSMPIINADEHYIKSESGQSIISGGTSERKQPVISDDTSQQERTDATTLDSCLKVSSQQDSQETPSDVAGMSHSTPQTSTYVGDTSLEVQSVIIGDTSQPQRPSITTMDSSVKESIQFSQETFMDKYRDDFMKYVPADAVVYEWQVYDIIDENTRNEVQKAPPSNKRAILFEYFRKNGSLLTIRKMSNFLIGTGVHGYPNAKSLGEDMREDLEKYS